MVNLLCKKYSEINLVKMLCCQYWHNLAMNRAQQYSPFDQFLSPWSIWLHNCVFLPKSVSVHFLYPRSCLSFGCLRLLVRIMDGKCWCNLLCKWYHWTVVLPPYLLGLEEQYNCNLLLTFGDNKVLAFDRTLILGAAVHVAVILFAVGAFQFLEHFIAGPNLQWWQCEIWECHFYKAETFFFLWDRTLL